MLFVHLQLKQKLTDAKLMQLATEVAVQDITSIAISDMGITNVKIRSLSKDTGHKSEMLNFEILRLWRNKSGNTREVSRTFLNM